MTTNIPHTMTTIPRKVYALLARGYMTMPNVPDPLPDDVCLLHAPLITSHDLGIQLINGFMPAQWIADSRLIIVEDFLDATPHQQGLLVDLADKIGKHRVAFAFKRPNDATIAAGNRAEDAARVSGMPVAATNRFNH